MKSFTNALRQSSIGDIAPESIPPHEGHGREMLYAKRSTHEILIWMKSLGIFKLFIFLFFYSLKMSLAAYVTVLNVYY